MKKYQDDEDRAAREAKEAALSQINQMMPNVTRPMLSSFIKTIQQEKHQAEEEWVH
jgi:hypothetical protein